MHNNKFHTLFKENFIKFSKTFDLRYFGISTFISILLLNVIYIAKPNLYTKNAFLFPFVSHTFHFYIEPTLLIFSISITGIIYFLFCRDKHLAKYFKIIERALFILIITSFLLFILCLLVKTTFLKFLFFIVFGAYVTISFTYWGTILSNENPFDILFYTTFSLCINILLAALASMFKFISLITFIVLLGIQFYSAYLITQNVTITTDFDSSFLEKSPTERNRIRNQIFAPFIETDTGQKRRWFSTGVIYISLGTLVVYSFSNNKPIKIAPAAIIGVLFFIIMLLIVYKPTYKKMISTFLIGLGAILIFVPTQSLNNGLTQFLVYVCLFYYLIFNILSEILLVRKSPSHKSFLWLCAQVPIYLFIGFILASYLINEKSSFGQVIPSILVFLIILFMAFVMFESTADDGQGDLSLLVNQANQKRLDSLDNYDELTPREIDVAMLLAKGYSRKDIAEELHISINTVKTHSSHIYQKLDVENQIKLIKALE